MVSRETYPCESSWTWCLWRFDHPLTSLPLCFKMKWSPTYPFISINSIIWLTVLATSLCILNHFHSTPYQNFLPLLILQVQKVMGFHFPGVVHAKQILRQSRSDVPNSYFAVYVGGSNKRPFVIPLSFLSQPSFRGLLCQAEEQFGYDHPKGGITVSFTWFLTSLDG